MSLPGSSKPVLLALLVSLLLFFLLGTQAQVAQEERSGVRASKDVYLIAKDWYVRVHWLLEWMN